MSDWVLILLGVLFVLFVAPLLLFAFFAVMWWWLDNTVGRALDWWDTR